MQVLKVPYNAGSLKEGGSIDEAPDLIEEAVDSFYMSEEGMLPVLDFEEVGVDNDDLDFSKESIRESVSSLQHFSVVLGGDHSITKPAFRGFAKERENPGLIVFDAHPDFMESFDTHEDYLRGLIEDDVVKPENVVIVGNRNSDKEEIQYIKDNDIKCFSMKELEIEGREEVCESIMSIARRWSDLYISIDIDVLDPAFAPGVSYSEPGGLSTRDLIYFIHRMKNLDNLGLADIVEVNPGKDFQGLTVKSAAKLLVELS